MIKSLIFDFGGTIDTNGIHWIEMFWSEYKRHSIQILKDEFIKAYIFAERRMNDKIKPGDSFKFILKNQLSMQFEYLFDNNLLDFDEHTIDTVVEECYSYVKECISLFNDIISELADNFSLAVISNFYGNLETVLREFNIRNYFKVITDSALLKIRKPDPKIFLITLRELSVKPEESFVIGDSYDNDIQPAQKIGCKTIWLINKTYKEKEVTLNPDYKISSVNQLKSILKPKNILQK